MRQNGEWLPEAEQVQMDVQPTTCPSRWHFLNVVNSCCYLKHEAEKANVNICPTSGKQRADFGEDASKKLWVIQGIHDLW